MQKFGALIEKRGDLLKYMMNSTTDSHKSNNRHSLFRT